MQLYFAPNSISIAVVLTLEEAALTYKATPVDFASAQQSSPGYLAVNPKGRVPALVTPQGTLTETGAILDYINAIAPAAALAPKDPYLAAKMRELMYYLASTAHVNHAHKRRGPRWADKPESWEDMRAKVPQTMAACAQYIEENFIEHPYVLGKHICLADPYLYVITTWLEGDSVDIANYPKLQQFKAAMEERESVQRTRDAGWI